MTLGLDTRRDADPKVTAFSTRAYRGRSTESTKPPVVATTIWQAHEPAAMMIVLRKYRSSWTSTQAVLRFDQSVPLGHNAIGCRSVSWVGVIADLASHSSGPSEAITRRPSSPA